MMTSFYQKVLLVGIVISTLLVPSLSFARVQEIPSSLCTTWGISCGVAEGENSFTSFITRIVNVLLSFVALVAVIMIIFGGVRYILSAGDEDAAKTAKRIILYAVIGLLVIGLSAAVVNFTINAIQGRGDVGPAPPTPEPEEEE